MIIKFIPENDQERSMFSEETHTNVVEFFTFGQKKDADGQMLDFHNWRGNHRYLLGSIDYFYEVLNDERRSRALSTVKFPTNHIPNEQQNNEQKFNLFNNEDNKGFQIQDNEEKIDVTPDVSPMPEPGFDLQENKE